MSENELNENKEMVLFENSKIRRQMYNGEWYYSVVDIVSILTEQEDYQKSRKYWNKLKERLQKEESFEVVTNCHQLKLLAKDGKKKDLLTVLIEKQSLELYNQFHLLMLNHLNYGLHD